MTIKKSDCKDDSIYGSIYGNKDKDIAMSRVSKLDQEIAEKLDNSIDISKVIDFSEIKTLKEISEKVDSITKDIEEGRAEEGEERESPLSKTLNIPDLQGKRRKTTVGTTVEASYQDESTGKHAQAHSNETVYKETEPPYFKVYMNVLARINDVPQKIKTFLIHLGNFMTFEGSVQVTKKVKERLAKELGVSEGTIKNYLSQASKSGLLNRTGGGEYVFHPSCMGRGSWRDIKQQRTELANHAIGILRLDHKSNDQTEQKFEFLDVETAKKVLKLLGADEEAIDKQISIASKQK